MALLLLPSTASSEGDAFERRGRALAEADLALRVDVERVDAGKCYFHIRVNGVPKSVFPITGETWKAFTYDWEQYRGKNAYYGNGFTPDSEDAILNQEYANGAPVTGEGYALGLFNAPGGGRYYVFVDALTQADVDKACAAYTPLDEQESIPNSLLDERDDDTRAEYGR